MINFVGESKRESIALQSCLVVNWRLCYVIHSHFDGSRVLDLN
ncbi:Conserved hypothetical protein [Prochlorococcus marinus str. MIT 9303]|uniref:Uncharacterized protein n=1 Tax=Prochlorococcus marinus (strain MIT 9303) TaxID=59922 RepID=A2CCM4_PROM3|nr:Conserved hypothetical protein [Prochlorococcus marinus str. MIT 9303]